MTEIAIYGRGRSLVEAAGWGIDRRIDVSILVQNLESVGFEVPALFRQFMETFWKLRVEHLPSIVLNGREIRSWTEFDPMHICTESDSRVAIECEKLVKTPLCPVGINGFHLTIYMSPVGEFYAGINDSVYWYANNADEFFVKLSEGAAPHHVGDWGMH